MTKEEVQKRIDDYFGKDSVEIISEVANKRSVVQLKCKNCGHIWETKAQNICYKGSQVRHKYCPNCLKKSREDKWVITNCSYCGKEMQRLKSTMNNKTQTVFCSKACGNKYKNEIREVFTKSNYRNKAFQYQEHKCACCGWHEDERILEVHHKDENRNHNDLSNLIILCPICHRKITLGYYILDDANKKLIEVEKTGCGIEG